MPRFIHIDQSLCRVGGHEYSYALSMLSAAQDVGYQAVLATNRRFRCHADLPKSWLVHREFPAIVRKARNNNRLPLASRLNPNRSRLASLLHAPTSRFDLAKAKSNRRLNTGNVLSRLGDFVAASRRKAGFVQACHRLFKKIDVREGDLVFFASFNDTDLAVLTEFLGSHPGSHLASWHFQFHVYGGVDCDPNSEPTRKGSASLAHYLESIKHLLPDHQTHFYCTTAELTSFYNQTPGASFQHLPFTVNPSLGCRDKGPEERLRVTYAGGVRREKGARTLTTVVKSITEDALLASRVEVAAPLTRKQMSQLGVRKQRGKTQDEQLPIVPLHHPLPTAEYHDLIRQTDIGLFLYDAQKYRRRCSGVLPEMLAAGKPVLVPAGTWLAQQIAEPIDRHMDHVRNSSRLVQQWDASNLAWRSVTDDSERPVATGKQLHIEQSEVKTVEIPVPVSADMFLFRADWGDSTPLATLLDVEIEQIANAGNPVKQFTTLLTPPYNSQRASTLIRLTPGTSRIVLRLRNVANSDRISIADPTCSFLEAPERTTFPLGQVGLAFAHLNQIPELLQDIVNNFDHYRESAQAFSQVYRDAHDPSQTVAFLTQVDQQSNIDRGDRAA